MLFRAAACAALLAVAPLQCGHTPESELQQDESPGDALWQLAQKFQAEHRTDAEKQTLEYLVERFPASRWVGPAKERIAALGGGSDAG